MTGPIRVPAGGVLAHPLGGVVLGRGGPPAVLPVLSLPVAVSVNEGQAATVTVAKAGAGACSATVRTAAVAGGATPGVDYTAVPGTVLSFAADEAAKTVTVQTAADADTGTNETFRVELDAPDGCTLGNAACLVTIVEPPPVDALPVLSVPDQLSVAEGGALAVTVAKAGAGACSVTVRTADLTALAGADYTALAPTVLVFASGDLSRTFTVQTAADAAAEGSETFEVILSAPVNCTVSGTGRCTATILNATADQPVTLFAAGLANADTVPTLADQELAIGQSFAKGDVPAGSVVRALVDGQPIPLQVSNRTTWSDGSLKWGMVRMLAPSVAVGATKPITWQRVPGTWTAHDTPLHANPTAVTGKVALQYAFTSFRTRTSAGALGAEQGPKTFHSGDMLGPSNAPWTERTMGGPVCSEWRASDMAKLPDGTRDPQLGCFLYARAWGGTTADNPKRIQFVFRSIYGWSDGMPDAQKGIRCSLDLRVAGTLVRGAGLATPTPGWADRDGCNGGFYASPGPSGEMDWYDVATARHFTPPRLLYRINTAYGVASRFLPPYDIANPTYAAPTAERDYLPHDRGGLRVNMGAAGDDDFITWCTSRPFARAMVAHGRAGVPAADAATWARDARVSAWGIAGLSGIGLNRATRRVICHLPPARNPDPTALGASVYNGTAPAFTHSSAGLNPYSAGQDAAHFPQVTWWTLITEGDQHFLDLAYHEMTLPGMFVAPTAGFYNPNQPNPIWPDGYQAPALAVGGVAVANQTRGAGHAARPILNVMAVGRPSDPHHKLALALWQMFQDGRRAVIRDADWWRNPAQPADGRYFWQVQMNPYENDQEPSYKVWMHSFSVYSNSYGYGVTEDPGALTWARWWGHLPTVLGGGYRDSTDPAHYLWRPDPVLSGFYFLLCSQQAKAGVAGATTNDRRPLAWIGQWGPVSACTYRADGRTIDIAPRTAADGMVVTVTGIHDDAEPQRIEDWSKAPAGLVRGQPYFAVQSSGTTCRLSATLGGAPVTFSTGGADLVGQVYAQTVNGAPGHAMRPASSLSIDANSYHNQLLGCLDVYQHYVAPGDARVVLARATLRKLREERGGQYDLRAKFDVATSASSDFSTEFTTEFA